MSGKPGNVMEFQNWPKLSWKCHGKLKKLVKTWKCHGILKNKCRPGKFLAHLVRSTKCELMLSRVGWMDVWMDGWMSRLVLVVSINLFA